MIYDEIEKFREHDHPEFSYPFQKRKSKLNSFTLDSRDFVFNNGALTLSDYDYSR